MEKLRQIQIDLLKNFISVCETLGIQYFMVCGSVLGAVKYQGYVPWDDDIDVALLRPDYELFMEKAQALLPKYIFVQNYYSDPAYASISGKLRNSNTTFIETSAMYQQINHGVYIDVFPIDGYPESWIGQQILEIRKTWYKIKLLTVINTKASPKVEIMKKFFRLSGVHKRIPKILKKYEDMISRYSVADAKVWCNHGNWQGKLEYADRDQYGNGTLGSFEGIQVRLPENTEAYLTQKYGQWREDLPEELKKSHHYFEIYDPEESYKKYT